MISTERYLQIWITFVVWLLLLSRHAEGLFTGLPVMFGFGFKLLLTLFFATSQGQNPLVVRTDLGGQIGARSAQIWLLGNRPIEIVGWCESACTMYLAAPNVCVTKNAHLVFHGPSWFGVPMARGDFEIASRFIAQHYPPSLAEWYLREGRFGRFGISGAEIIANGWARECD